MATGKQIRISIISALNAAGIEATKEQVASMSRSVQKSMQDAAKSNRRHWADIKAAWDMGLAAIRHVGGMIRAVLKKAFDAEYALTNFKTMLGSIDAAKQHVAELKAFAASTPLTFDDLAQASKTLLAFGADVKTVMPSLKMLGDISLGNAEKFQSLSLAFGKVTSEGKLTGVTLKQMIVAGFNPLQEIATKTGATMDDLKKQMEKGEISFDLVKAAIESATSEGGRFHNAMQDASQTGKGLFSTMEDNWNAALAKFGGAFTDAAKGGMTEVIEKMQELNNDGTIELWANKTVEAFNSVKEAAMAVGTAIKWLYDKSGLSDIIAMTSGIVKSASYSVTRLVAGMNEGEGFMDAMRAADKEYRQVFMKELAGGHWIGQMSEKGWLGSGMQRAVEDNKADEAYQAEEDEAFKARAKKAAEAKARAEAEARQKQFQKGMTIEEAYEKERAKAKEKADAKAAQKKAEQEKKAAEKAAKERERLEKQEEVRRERARQKELAAMIKDHQKLLAAQRDEESKTRSAVSAAESKLQQAWGWYRNKDSMAAQLEEEKADAAARKQFEKDFAKLKDRRRDWRTAENLSVDDEAVRRVALAREEKEAAEKHLAEIEKNTADLAEKLDELLQVKG